MRSYDVTATALALGVPSKWVDNVLSHHRVPGVAQSRQGVRRRLAPDSVLTLGVALELIETLAMPAARAISVAAETVATRAPVRVGKLVELTIDLERVEREMAQRLASAAEAAPPRRRGRPLSRRHDP